MGLTHTEIGQLFVVKDECKDEDQAKGEEHQEEYLVGVRRCGLFNILCIADCVFCHGLSYSADPLSLRCTRFVFRMPK